MPGLRPHLCRRSQSARGALPKNAAPAGARPQAARDRARHQPRSASPGALRGLPAEGVAGDARRPRLRGRPSPFFPIDRVGRFPPEVLSRPRQMIAPGPLARHPQDPRSPAHALARGNGHSRRPALAHGTCKRRVRPFDLCFGAVLVPSSGRCPRERRTKRRIAPRVRRLSSGRRTGPLADRPGLPTDAGMWNIAKLPRDRDDATTRGAREAITRRWPKLSQRSISGFRPRHRCSSNA